MSADPRYMLLSILIAIPTTGLGQAPNAKGEAISYFEASKVLMHEKQPYDVTVTIEESVLFNDVLVPAVVTDWRIRRDESSEFIFFAYTERRISMTEALKGQMDNWAGSAGVLLIDGGETTHHMLNQGVSKRKRPDFLSLTKVERFPRFENFGLGMFGRTVWNPSNIDQMVMRVLARASTLEVTPTRRDGEELMRVQAVLKDDRLEETHIWLFSSLGIAPVHYSIYQKGNLQSERTEIFEQSIEWEEHDSYGNVPVTVTNSADARVRIVENQTASEGNKESSQKVKFFDGKRFKDVRLVWHDFGDSSDNAEFIRDKYTYTDVDLYVR